MAVNATAHAVEVMHQAVRLGDLLTPAVCAGCFGLLMWFLRENFSALKADIKEMKVEHGQCQVALARDYMTKSEIKADVAGVKEDLRQLWNRTDGHGERIAKLEERCAEDDADGR